MQGASGAYTRKVVVAVTVATVAALLVLGLYMASRVLLLIFGGVLLAVLLRGLGELVSEHEGYVLSPLVFQRSVDIPPLVTMSAQVVLGTMLGVLGIVFATPLTACALVLVKRVYVEDVLGDLMDAQPGSAG